jgi:hypothetical protein
MNGKIDFFEYEQLGETREFIFGKKKVSMEVVKIPMEILSYNKKNGRIFLGVNKREKHGVNFEDLTQSEFNDEIEDIIWHYDKDKNKSTLASIKEFGQLEIALISDEKNIIDGNRRFTCLRKLHRDDPEKDEYSYLKACVLDENIKKKNNIDKKDIKRFELNVQFGKEEKANYHVIDRVMSIYEEVKSNNLTISEIVDDMNTSKGNINQTVRTAEVIDDFLNHLKIEEKYYVVDKLDLVNPLGELAKYLKSTSAKDLPETELNVRKNIFYELVLGGDFSLPTQTLRDGLVKKVYKNKDEQLSKDFVEEYEETVAQDIYEFLEQLDYDEPKEAKDEFKKSHSAKTLNKLFVKYKERGGLKKTIEEQLNLAEKAKQALEEIDLNLFDKVTDDNSEITYLKLQKILKDVNDITDKLINEF